MLLRDLKKVASSCCINPKKPTVSQKIVMGVGNPHYWTTKAVEYVMQAKEHELDSMMFKTNINRAIELLILTQAYNNEEAKVAEKTGNSAAKQNSSHAES